MKAGARLRGISIDNISNNNFAGTYSFTSLDQYRNVLSGVSGEGSGGNGGFSGGGPFGGGSASNNKYNLTFSLQTSNLFNNTNAGTPIGNLSSSLFGVSNSLAGGFGFGQGGGSSSAAYNRRVEAQIRFSF